MTSTNASTAPDSPPNGNRVLAGLIRSAREAMKLSQADLAERLDISAASTISQFETSKRLPSIGQLVQLSAELKCDCEQLVLAWAWEQVFNEDKSYFKSTSRDELLTLLSNRLSPKRPTSSTRSGSLSLADWPNCFDINAVIVGDRRETPPHTHADILALSASTGDLTYFGDLGLANVRIRSDKTVKLASRESLRDKLGKDILVIGSPAANLAARIVNSTACFRFHVDPAIREREAELEQELAGIAYDAEALEGFVDPSDEERKQRIKDVHHLLYDFAKPGIVDPTSYPNELRGIKRGGRNDFGVVTLCKNPWSDDGIAILAAGIGGPGTAAALKLLSHPQEFAKHPLGGVFKVTIGTEAPWEDRYDLLRPRWDSNPYTIDEFQTGVQQLAADRDHATLSSVEATEIDSLLELLRKRGHGAV